ncbi:hypothetical protein RhiXN_04509 [Rhizoctonia solani]|uniref:UDP-xylose and UDP-N-acetylglucosamine transporter n=1 Tax=Rhizoctonia solani TaxID=456999 RepID=A0A8H8NQG9_9AGAM|nr:uncharacterized protein RhiXN_04509 [Rhizoctonia solani]QRW16508.1 hypothetical protein RhiXN_04509 [Rhizoctonia solani]
MWSAFGRFRPRASSVLLKLLFPTPRVRLRGCDNRAAGAAHARRNTKITRVYQARRVPGAADRNKKEHLIVRRKVGDGEKVYAHSIASVLLVTAGVALSTMSSLSHKRPKPKPGDEFHTTSFSSFTQDHLVGLSLLTLALVLSGLMGLAQERTYAKYGRHWQEGMFYLHFLALPMFALPGIGGDLVHQVKLANASPPVSLQGHIQTLAGSPIFRPAGPLGARVPTRLDPILDRILSFPLFSITLPSFYVPLAINVFTQFLCVGGVHRLTSQVSSLSVTLVLVVRKAVSLWISVVLVGGNGGDVYLWGGALAVVVGTVMYSLDQGQAREKVKEKEL